MTIEMQRFDTASEMRDATEAFLMRNEAHHNLILGLIERLAESPDFYPTRPYFAAAVEAGETVGAALMTPPYALVLSLCDVDEAIDALAADVHACMPGAAGVNSVTAGARRFAEAWQALTGEAYEVELSERIYRLEQVHPPEGVPGAMRRVSEADFDLLVEWQAAFARETTPWEDTSREHAAEQLRRLLASPPEVMGRFVWEVEGEPVCMVGYGRPTANGVSIAPVYTPPEYRRRGYASACTAAVCEHLLANGKSFVTLFADLANPTSNHVYQSIGFEAVCAGEMILFRR